MSTPFIGTGIARLMEKYPDQYTASVERHLSALDAYYGGDPQRLRMARDAFVEMTFEMLRMQSRFFKTGEFSLSESEKAETLADAARMEGHYLTGLFLAAVFWQNHFEKMIYFEGTVLPLLPEKPKVLDIGPGSGLFTALTLLHRPKAMVTVNDLSPFSEPLVLGLRFGDFPSKPKFILGAYPEAVSRQGEIFDFIIFSDVIEHLQDPPAGMNALKSLLTADGIVFFATATNAAFYDHSMVFEGTDEIEALIAQQGFRTDCVTEIPVFKNPDGRITLDYLAVLSRTA